MPRPAAASGSDTYAQLPADEAVHAQSLTRNSSGHSVDVEMGSPPARDPRLISAVRSPPRHDLGRKAERERSKWEVFEQLQQHAQQGPLNLSVFESVLRKEGRLQEGEEEHAELRTVFKEIDADRNGDVTWGEFRAWQQNNQRATGVFARFLSGQREADTIDDDATAAAAAAAAAATAEHPAMSVEKELVDTGFANWYNVPDCRFTLTDTDCVEEQSQDVADICSATSAIDSEMDDTRKQLEDLQIKTISGLVEDVSIDVGDGTLMPKKLLYLTNTQAREFDKTNLSSAQDLDRVLFAMEIKQPRLIITLFASWMHDKNTRSGSHISHPMSSILSSGTHGEETEWDLMETIQRAETFARDILLPLAVQTEALVISGDTNCHVSMAFSGACVQYAKCNGGSLPFTVLNFSAAPLVKYAAETPQHIAHNLREASVRQGSWKSRHSRLDLTRHERCSWTLQDLPPGCSHFIMIDGQADNGAVDVRPRAELKAAFVQKLTMSVPSIAIATLDTNMDWIHDYIARGMPVLLMDHRPPPRANGTYATNFGGMAHDMLEKHKRVLAAGRQSTRSKVSNMAHVAAVLKAVTDRDAKFERDHSEGAESGGRRPDDENGAFETVHQGLTRVLPLSPGKWIHNVVDDWERTERAQRDGLGDADGRIAPSREERASEGVRVMENLQRLQDKIEATWCLKANEEQTKLLRAVQETPEDAGIDGLNKWLEQLTVLCKHEYNWTGYLRKTADINIVQTADKLFKAHDARAGGFLGNKRAEREGHLYCWVPQIAVGKEGLPKVVDMKKALLETLQAVEPEIREFLGSEISKRYIVGAIDGSSEHQKRKAMLLSKALYSANLYNLKQVEQVMNQVARIDRLPEQNTIEATRILCSAWDSVDLFAHQARKSKFVAKVSYGVLLMIGLAASTITVLSINRPDIVDNVLRGRIVIALSIAGTMVASWTTFLDPGQRWMQLQGAALGLEAECWKFRARCGIYSLKSEKDTLSGKSEHQLQAVVEAVRGHVAKSASISETAFGSSLELFNRPRKDKLSVYTHGQYRGCGIDGTFGHAKQVREEARQQDDPDAVLDDHHSPLPPEAYLRLRVEPMVRFYQGRLPAYYRSRTVFEVLLLVGSLAGTVMAFFKVDEWVAIAAAVSALVTAWAAFTGTKQKLNRYSNTIEKVQSIMLWWRALTPTDKALPAKIRHLVMSCEEAFEREREGWASTSMTTALLAQTASDDQHGDEDHDKKKC